MRAMDELVRRFHTLQGTNLQETKRNLNELIDVIRDLPLETDLDTLIASIKPKTKLESILKVEILIRFQRYDALLEVLKGGNPMLIAKVLKCWEFFEVFFIKIDSQTLVGQIFLHTSFSTRTKIITRLSTNLRNEELADEYFYAIEGKYGLSAAKRILSACSLDLIGSIVATYKLILTSRQLLRIVKRNREFLSYYFDVIHQAYGHYIDFSIKYPQVLKYLAKVDEQVFWELFKKYQLKLKFGRHMTSRLLYESGQGVVTTFDYDLKLFNPRKLYKVVGKNEGDLRCLILQLFQKTVINFICKYCCCCLKTIISCIPKHKRYEVLNDCFEEFYGKSMQELVGLDMPEEIMEFMPVQEREIILDKKVPGDESLIYMYSTKKAIPLLLERIKFTSKFRKRNNLLVQLNKTCMFNRDSEALLEVLKYVRSGHRNGNLALCEFMISLQDWPKLEKLTGEHWSYINELLNICLRMTIYRLNLSDINLMLKYLVYLVENHLSYEEFMESFLVHLIDKQGSFGVFFNKNLRKREKMCFDYFARLLPKLYTGDEFENWSCMFLATIAIYNNQHPRNRMKISRYPRFIEIIKSQLTKEKNFNPEVVLIYYLKFEDEGMGDQIFWENYKKVCNADTIIWYLRKRPNKILEHLDKILTPQIIQVLMYKLPQILNLVSMLPSISEKIISFSLKALHDDDAAVSKFAAISLSYLAAKEEYFEAARCFVPHSEGKIDFKLTKENFVATLEAIVGGLANLDDPASCLPILLEFCVGDYMKYVSRPLYQVTSHTPESKLAPFLDPLYNSAVSVRKHAVTITARISPKSTVYAFLKDSGQNDKHPSIRKTIFKSTLKYFIANPSEEFWSLLKDNVKIIHQNDRETLGFLAKLHRLPGKYLSEYFSMAYTILSNNEDKEIQMKKSVLLASARNELLNELDANCLMAVLKDVFPNGLRRTDFDLRCLFYTTGSKNALILELIFSILKDYVEKDSFLNKDQTNLYMKIYCICVRAVAFKFGKDVIEKFMEFWTSTVKHGKLKEEYLLLQLTNAYLRFADNPRTFGAKVSELLGEWVELLGPTFISLFIERLYDFSLANGRKDIEFIEGFLDASDADFNYIVALNLLFSRVCWNSIKNKYGSILTKIKEHKSSAVQIYLQQQLRTVQD